MEFEMSMLDQRRFWSKVAPPNVGGCLLWTGAKFKRGGYGQFSMRGHRTLRAHRVSFFLCGGTLGASEVVCHRCDNPPCCNPDHLFAGTARENTRDCVEKGRLVLPNTRGANNAFAKLSNENVVSIRERIGAGVALTALAREHGVTVQAISNIKRGKTWSWL